MLPPSGAKDCPPFRTCTVHGAFRGREVKMKILRKHFLAEGIVQGVGFRHHTAVTASRLGLTGWVRNLPDGSVEIQAQGSAKPLEMFEEWIRSGPHPATVRRLTILESPPLEGEPGFGIRHFP